ncbi:Hsp33 family molecular chaperone HslO [Natronogracilivirga saccharolytica]|uniref:33 kDa chaperonin n=1 Tax=Natronogracilivirga saccharolytica TaxID=2812953 RepID=A0A8J7UW05_9BACT|nr:Hsp33 family molecular chaperone HslO [Natronogracilivirga saccharolytica]MBP3191709.1 Hsp33 family molecular chaperone HslO [Natronogracilivirga saccharolytica]
MNKEEFKHRDRLLKAISENGHYRIIVVKTTEIVRTARNNHNLSLLPTVLLGRTLTAALLLASNLKGEERIQIKLQGNGPVGSVTAEATSHGEVRGYVASPDAALDLANNEKLGDGIGIGLMTVSKVLYNKARPVTGTVDLVRGNVNEDLAHYLLQSEQVPSAVSLDVALDEHGDVAHAGGVLVQAMPGAEQEETERIENNIRHMPQIGEQLQSTYLDGILATVSEGMPVRELDRYPVDFFCRCSRERFQKSLALVNPDDLLKMNAETEELVCHYCGERYEFSGEEIEAIAHKAKLRQN